jgi:sugar (pentulose or hexulose) kinase
MKAVALDDRGQVVARASAGYPTSRTEPGASEQDPHDWIDATISCARQIRQQSAEPWAVIGLSGMIPTLVTADADGMPVGPAITWQDARADREGDELRMAIGPDALYAATGQWVDGRYLLPMLARLARVDPERIRASRTLMSAKDFLVAWLTGSPVTDPSTATGYGCFDLDTGAWLDPVRDSWGDLCGARLDLPQVVPSTDVLPLRTLAAEALGVTAGVPVCVGAADSVMGAIGMGVEAPGEVAYIGGTSTIILGLSDRSLRDDQHRFLVTPMIEAGTWGLEMDLLSTGAAFRWLSSMLGAGDESALLSLAASSTSQDPPVFLPYLAPGEQGALWDPELTGTLTGLNLATTPADIASALAIGIVLESRRCLAVLAELGFDDRLVYVSGGSASDAWFRQHLADAVGRSVVTSGGSETDRSAAGAAIVGARALGWRVGGAVADQDMSPPNRAAEGMWALRAERHDSALSAIRTLR